MVIRQIKSFLKRDTGATTVDWVVLSAAVIALGYSMMNMVYNSNEDISSDLSSAMSATTVVTPTSLGFVN
jgi:hypothetical protein